MDKIKVFILEDEKEIIDILRLYLEKEGYEVYSSTAAKDGLSLMEEVNPDVLLLDIGLPDENGFEIARKYRKQSNGILIFITGYRDNRMLLEGFEIGCDDYITKPFDPPEVIVRLKAILRRSGYRQEDMLEIGDLTLNFLDKSVTKNGKRIELFTKERQLLFYLATHPNQVFSTEHLFDVIWGVDSEADLKTVLVNVSTLRKKIEENPKKPKIIETVRGFGYKFTIPKK